MILVDTVFGIDPGKSGAIVCIFDLHKTPGYEWDKLRDYTPHDIAEFLRGWKGDGQCMAVIEQVHSMPGQGVSSTFKFGENYGMLQGALAALKIPYTKVTPAKWQRAMGCLSKGDKNVTKARAQELHPEVKMTHWLADALLIAEYARQTYSTPTP